MTRWYLAKDGQIVGPVDDATIRRWVTQRAILPGTWICREGDSQWRPFESSPFCASPRVSLGGYALAAFGLGVLLLCAALGKKDPPTKERPSVTPPTPAVQTVVDVEGNERRQREDLAQRNQAAARGQEQVVERLRAMKAQERTKLLRECFESTSDCPDSRGPDPLFEGTPTAAERKRLETLWKQLGAQRERVAAAERRASAPLLCCDGALSPSCTVTDQRSRDAKREESC